MMAPKNTRYEPLEFDEGGDSVHERLPLPQRSVFLAPRTRADWIFVGANVGLFLLTLFFWFSGSKSSPSELECAKVVSPYSPVFPAVEFWEGDFVNYFDHETIYRGPPTQAREQAWDDLWHHQGVGVSKEGATALNKTAFDTYLQTSKSTPAKPEYYALVGMFHQLHCLNQIRQATWPANMYDESWGAALQPLNLSETASRFHIDHCIETLRLSLMCAGDVTPMLVISPDGKTFNGSHADFNVHHKCRSYEKIRDFVDAAAVHPAA